MDTTAQDTAQNDQQQPVAAQPVSASLGKEIEPIVIQPKTAWVTETAPEATISQDLQEAGVKTEKSEAIKIPEEVAQAGVTPAGAAAPLPTEPTVSLPMSEEKAKGYLGIHTRVKKSVTWLAMLIMKHLQRLRFQRKKEAKK